MFRTTLLWRSPATIALILQFAATGLAFAQQKTTVPCSAPEYHQFDFWIGDWDTFDMDNPNTVIARNHVSRILDGCALLEDYSQNDGLHGQSFNIYDVARGVWVQSWVTNRGELLIAEGKLQNGAIALSGPDHTADGKLRQVHATWKPVDGGVRETAVVSTDAGKSWKPWFDIIFRPHQVSSKSTNDDAKTVAALDKQYQAAVKNNDADAMDRILADDFVLVVGSGKTFNKAALLEEARSKQYLYEHQEDSVQSVRVWGDTAVVTAKLWAQGTHDGRPFDYTLWFSDTYLRTPGGWRYVFGQASSALPKPPL